MSKNGKQSVFLFKADLALKQMSSEIDNRRLQIWFSLIWQSCYVSFSMMWDFELVFMMWMQLTECTKAVHKVFKHLCPHVN